MLAWKGVLSHDSVLSCVLPTPPDESIGDSNVEIGAKINVLRVTRTSVNAIASRRICIEVRT